MGTLTLSMIVKNEEANLSKALSNISQICDEIIIVDTGSVDRTIEIARSFGAVIIEMEWDNDFAKARNLSIRDAASDWILWIDGDDYIPAESIPHIKELLQSEPDCVYAFTVKNERPDGTGTEFLQARLFPNHKGLYFERPVHEQIMLSALRQGLEMRPSSAWVEHHGYADPDEMKLKAERNVTILEQNLDLYGEDPVTFVEIGDSYTILGDRERAEFWYRRTVELDGADALFPDVVSQAWMGLGNIANVRKEFEKAENCFKSVIAICPERIDLFYNLAVTYERQERYQLAVETLEKIFTSVPGKIKVGVDVRQAKIRGGMKMIRLLLRMGNEAVLREKINFLQDMVPDRLEIVNVCAAALYSIGEYLEALRLFERSVNECPEGNIDALVGLSLIYIAAGKDELALRQVQQGAEQFRDNCRYQLFRTLFSNDYLSLRLFHAEKVHAEITYLTEIFGLNFNEELIIGYALPDEEE